MNKILAVLLLVAGLVPQVAHSLETGPAGSVYMVPGTGGRPKFQTPPDRLDELQNVGLSASVASNALTIALKQKDGSTNCSMAAPCKIAFRSSTATSGAYNLRSVTGALSLVISSGSTLGHSSGNAHYIYVYALDNSGTIELAASHVPISDLSVQSTTAEGGAGAADSASVPYSTTARSNVPIRLIARLKSTQTTAGTWAAVPTDIALATQTIRPLPVVSAKYVMTGSTANTSLPNSSEEVLDWDSKSWDEANSCVTGASFKCTAPIPGKYLIMYSAGLSAVAAAVNNLFSCSLYKNGSAVEGVFVFRYQTTSSIDAWNSGATEIKLAAGDYVDIRCGQNTGGTVSFNTGGSNFFMSFQYIGE